MPDISIIVPVYQNEKYLERCIKSIVNQSFSNFELILVDDGSTDMSKEICDEYSLNDSRIKVIHQVNQGVATARNNGISHASGMYLAFVDSDDWIHPRFLEVMYNICINNDADMAMCSLEETENQIMFQELITPASFHVMDSSAALQKYGMLLNGKFKCVFAKLIKTEIVVRHTFPKGRHYGEDCACTYLWINDSKRIVDIDCALYYYFQNPTSAIHKKLTENRLDNLITYHELLSFYKRNNMNELFRHTFCAALLETGKYTEIARAQNNNNLSEQYKDESFQFLQEWFGLMSKLKTNNREDLTLYLKELSDKSYLNDYVIQCANSMAIHLNYQDYGKLLGIKKRLQLFLMRYHPSISKCAYAYNSVFPRTMQFYWHLYGGLEKLKKLARSYYLRNGDNNEL